MEYSDMDVGWVNPWVGLGWVRREQLHTIHSITPSKILDTSF